MNGRHGKAKFSSLRILLYYEAISSTIRGKYMIKLRNNMTNTVHSSTKGGGFNTNYISKVEIVLPKLDKRIMAWNFHVDDCRVVISTI